MKIKYVKVVNKVSLRWVLSEEEEEKYDLRIETTIITRIIIQTP